MKTSKALNQNFQPGQVESFPTDGWTGGKEIWWKKITTHNLFLKIEHYFFPRIYLVGIQKSNGNILDQHGPATVQGERRAMIL